MINDNTKEFIRRHIGPSDEDMDKMLKMVGANSLDDLIKKTVPEDILLKDKLKIGDPTSEHESMKQVKVISEKNRLYKNYIGMGYYNTYMPNVILRNIYCNPGWYTAYTPYQPEVAQGRLEMLLNFQQMVLDFTGMDIANASLLDESTAAAEAIGLSRRLDKHNSNQVFVSKYCNPQTIDVIKTRTEVFNLKLIIGDQEKDLSNIDGNIICGVLSYPGTLGDIKDPSKAISKSIKKMAKLL